MKHLHQSSWIWTCAGDNSPDIYRLFRRRFDFVPQKGKSVQLEISVCSTFDLKINGVSVAGQQLSDYPDSPTGSRFDVTGLLCEGENHILLEVHYVGADFHTGVAGIPFVKLALFCGDELLLFSDDSWEWCDMSAYRSGLECKVTSQLGFVFEYAAERFPQAPCWQKAAVLDGLFDGVSAGARSVPQLTELPLPPAEVVQQGVFKRMKQEGSFADCCMTDAMIPIPFFDFYDGADQKFISCYINKNFKLQPDGSTPLKIRSQNSFDPIDGSYVVLDLGKEQVGYLKLEITAPAGTVVDISHGEHLDAGRVAAKIENRSFTDRYICSEGKNAFIYRHRRLGCRYIELHILSTQEVTVTYCGLIPLELPLPGEAAFECEDRLLVKNRELAVRTLNLCMHEHYEDCPWREQALYGYDSRNQMLYGYYTWGNYDFAASSIDLLGRSFDGERYFSLTAPGGRASRTIPVFTLVWISELLEYQLFSGSGELFDKWQRQVDQILDTALANKVPGYEDFYHPGDDPRIWNFCEWNGRLTDTRKHPSSTYNIYLYEALNAAAQLHTWAGNPGRAGELSSAARCLGEAAENFFWSEEKKVFMLTQTPDTPEEYEHVQSIFLANKLGSAHRTELIGSLLSRRLSGISFSGLPYFLKALKDSSPEGRRYLDGYLDKLLTPMLLAGSTSLWETADGSTAFNRAGSLCHAWSSIMPCYCGSVLLGVVPLEPGFRRFQVRPYCGKLTHASGEIPTPCGPICVRWQLRNGMIDLELEHPDGMIPEISGYGECPIRSVNGKVFS